MYSKDNLPRWYFGGVASAMAVFFTHPLDLIKVLLQTQTTKTSVPTLVQNIVQKDGVLALYNGVSASIFRQLTYGLSRFAIYDMAKEHLGKNATMDKRAAVAAGAGAFGGWIGTPADKVNVRMQNDMRLPRDQRVNYKHVLDGLWQVYKHEGVKKLFTGGATASMRAAVMAVGQLCSYDHIKFLLLETSYFEDNIMTHFAASLGAAAIATTVTQPLDVIKTRIMNAKPGIYSGITDVIVDTARKDGPLGFFKGYIPAFLRIGPHTILLFIFYEQMRLNFGKTQAHRIDN